MEIRAAVLDDVEQIYEIMKSDGRRAYTKDLAIDLIENSQSLCLVITENNQIVGSLGARGEGKDSCWLYYIIVREEFRHKGHARELMKRFLDNARRMGAKSIALDTPDREFFEKFGFKEVGRLPGWYEDMDQVITYMDLK
jgi:amino-acid N-acetyltransferase